MRFRTELIPNKSDCPISYQSKILLLGSCFSENLGLKLKNARFYTTINPLGTFYNPASAARLIRLISSDQTISKEELIQREHVMVHPDFHSRFNAISAGEAVLLINRALQETKDAILQASHLFLTLGTAWVYCMNDSGRIVSNCHKLPSSLFEKKLLSSDEIFDCLKQLREDVYALNPNCKVVLTLSPVRHTKDGLEENNLSKALLLAAIHRCVQNMSETSYFPSYEIVMDDLRDYRFYGEDLIHPNDIAVNYIWEKFQFSFMDESTISVMAKVNQIHEFFQHRPAITDSNYQTNKEKMEAKADELNPVIGIPFHFATSRDK